MDKPRSLVGVGVFILLGLMAAAGHWYETQRTRPQRTAEKTVLVHVTNAGDRGPGTLREALFIVAAASDPTTISIEVPKIDLETALPALVNGHGVRLVGLSGAKIDAHALDSGPVLDVSGPNTSIEGVTIVNCPASGILVRALRFRLSTSMMESCDVEVDIADNTSDTLLERNRFLKNRLGVRFAGSGHNSAVASNEFTGDKDAGLWAVRSAPDSHDDVIAIHDNKFTEDGAGIVAGNIPVLAERNDFINSHEAAVHLVGAGAVIRANRISGGASMGIVAENARAAVIEENELEGLTAYGVMVRGSSDTLVRANRLHNCGYGIAFVLGNPHGVTTPTTTTTSGPRSTASTSSATRRICGAIKCCGPTPTRFTSRTFSRPTDPKCNRSRFWTTTTSARARSAEPVPPSCRNPVFRRWFHEAERRQHPIDAAADLAEPAGSLARRHVAVDHRRHRGGNGPPVDCQRLRGGRRNGELGAVGARRNLHHDCHPRVPHAAARAVARSRVHPAGCGGRGPDRLHLAARGRAAESDVPGGICPAGHRRDISLALAALSHRNRERPGRWRRGSRASAGSAVVCERPAGQRRMALVPVRPSKRGRAAVVLGILCTVELSDRAARGIYRCTVRLRRGG